MDYELARDSEGRPYLKVSLTDYTLMKSALLNKGMAFTNQDLEQHIQNFMWMPEYLPYRL